MDKMSENNDQSMIDDLMMTYFQLKENPETRTEQWTEFTVFVSRQCHNAVQRAIKTKKREDNRKALHLCNVGLLAAQQIGRIHPVIPQIAFEAGLLHFQARQFFKAGQLFYLAHRSFQQLGNEELSNKALKHSIRAFMDSFKEFHSVAVRLTLDNYHDIGWNYVIRSIRSLISFHRATRTTPTKITNIDPRPQLTALLEFIKNEKNRFDEEKVRTLLTILQQLEEKKEISQESLTEMEKEILSLLPSRPRMLLIIYEDGRLLYGYDFENKTENSSFLVIMAGILFAIISVLSLELKVGTLNQLQTEEGIALVEKRNKTYFFLLCSGEPGVLRNNFQLYIDEFLSLYEQTLNNWHGELVFRDAKRLVDLIF